MADVRLPDGTIIRNVPAGTTKAQLMAKLGKAPQSQGIDWNPLNAINEMGVGMYNAASAVTDPIVKKIVGLIEGDEAAEQLTASSNRWRRGVADKIIGRPNPVARATGAILLPLPGKKLQEGGKLARGTYRAMQGAVGGAASREVDDPDALTPASIGAAANVVLPPVLGWLANTRAAQAVGGAVASVAKPFVNYLTGGADEAVAAMAPSVARSPSAARPLAPLGRKAEARAARFDKLGVKNPTTGQVTRDPTAFSFEQNQSKVVGNEGLAQQLLDVETSLVDKGRQIVRGQGGAKGSEATGKAVHDVLDAKRTEMQRITGKLYDDVRATRGDERIGNLDTLRQSFDESELADNPVFEDMTAAIVKRLGRYADRDGGAIGVTVRQADELRKFIGNLGNSADATTRLARKQLIDSLDDDVVNAVGDQPLKAARASARAGFEEFKKTVAGKIADEGIDPEKLTRRLLSDATSLKDIRAVRKSMLEGTDEQIARGTEAWRGLGGQAVGDLLKASVDAEGRLIGSNLSSAFVKQSEKLREILDPAVYKELRRLALAVRDVKSYPQGHSVNTSDTATTLANMFQATKPAVRDSWLKLLTKLGLQHGAAFATLGPVGNVGLVVGKNAAATAAEQKAAELLIRRVRMAQSPQETAAAIAAMKSGAQSNPVIADFLKRYGAGTGGAVAAASGEPR